LHRPRYAGLIANFEKTFGRKAEFVVRSPGRVNLIGEHIDYCGFGVLPMAIERDVIIVGATTDDDTKVRVGNVNPKYPAREFEWEGKEKVVTIDDSELEWSNYFKCGYKVIGGKNVRGKNRETYSKKKIGYA
jgi:galactokinase